MTLRRNLRRVGAALIGFATTAALMSTTATPAHAGQVGVNLSIEGAGAVTVVEGSLEGGWSTCERFANQDHRVTLACPRVRNDEPFEAWVWLRPTPSPVPAGEWAFAGWSGCDTSRVRDGVTECGVHSRAFSSDERYPIARFRDQVAPVVSDLRATQLIGSFRFHFNATGGTTECRVIGWSDYAPCENGLTWIIPEGRHTFQVRATDPSGNARSAAIDIASINTRITRGPALFSNGSAPRFDVTALGADTFWCSLDDADFAQCGTGPTGTVSLDNVADGAHRLRVYGLSGEWFDRSPAEWRWTVDTVAPTSTVQGTTTGTSATFTFSSPDADRIFCRLITPTHDLWTECSSPMHYDNLEQGEHHFEVRAVDKASNWDPTPPAHSWTVDTVAPTTTLAGRSSTDTATFEFRAAGATHFECRLHAPAGAGGWARCTSPTSYQHLRAGQHRFEVRAVDAAGNVEPTPAAHTWTATTPGNPDPSPLPDVTAPDTVLTAGPSGFVLSRNATVGLASEAGATFRCTLDSRTVACGTSFTISDLRSGTHALTAAAVDASGNVDATPVLRTWTVPASARELRVGKGWKLRTSSASYGGSRLESRRRGARLTHKVTGARSVALVVGKGRRYGTVKVFAGSRLLKTVRLASKRSQHQVVVPVGNFDKPYTGRLRIIVTSHGRPVRVEGLGVSTT